MANALHVFGAQVEMSVFAEYFNGQRVGSSQLFVFEPVVRLGSGCFPVRSEYISALRKLCTLKFTLRGCWVCG